MIDGPITAEHLYAALQIQYPAREYAIIPQATQGTGWRANRWLDALVMSLWPSRGLWIHGIEIKVYRGDWRRELRQPEKAEGLFKHLDYFSIAAPRGVVPPAELPKTWGLLEFDHADGKLAETVKAKTLHKGGYMRPLTREFFAGLCRRIDEKVLRGTIETSNRTEYDRGVKDGEANVRHRLSGRERHSLLADAFLRESHLEYRDETEAVRLGKLVGLLGELGSPSDRYRPAARLRELATMLTTAARGLEEILAVTPRTPSPTTPSAEDES